MQNQFTRMLGIEHPVIQGGMMEISRAKLVAAVSNAGGLGTLGQCQDLKAWKDELHETKALTTKPFSVNLPMHVPDLDKRLDIIIEQGVKVVTTAAGNPARVMADLKSAAITVLHVVGASAQAAKVEQAGANAIVAEGGESGGMVGKNRVSTMVLVPAVASAVKVPVIAAGGISDARGLVAALALGAQGVQIGTRFLATAECQAPDKWKQAICKASDIDTMVVPRGAAQGRVLKPELMENAMAGIVSGLITEVMTAEQVIKQIVGQAESILQNVSEQIASA